MLCLRLGDELRVWAAACDYGTALCGVTGSVFWLLFLWQQVGCVAAPATRGIHVYSDTCHVRALFCGVEKRWPNVMRLMLSTTGSLWPGTSHQWRWLLGGHVLPKRLKQTRA